MITSIRFLFVPAAILGILSGAIAQGRPATPAMTCAAAAELVARTGAIVLTTGPITYARFVRDGGFCPIPETPKPAFELTLDNAKCFVGYTCQDRFSEGSGRD